MFNVFKIYGWRHDSSHNCPLDFENNCYLIVNEKNNQIYRSLHYLLSGNLWFGFIFSVYHLI